METRRHLDLAPAHVARRLLREALIACAGVLVYFGVRGLTEGDVSRADEGAVQLVRLERALGLSWERSLQGAVDGDHLVVTDQRGQHHSWWPHHTGCSVRR